MIAATHAINTHIGSRSTALPVLKAMYEIKAFKIMLPAPSTPRESTSVYLVGDWVSLTVSLGHVEKRRLVLHDS
jgi:hypothetical protein